jgi:hypothetical protein
MLHVSRLFARRRAPSVTFAHSIRPRLEALEDRLPPGDLWSLRAVLFPPAAEPPTLTADPGDLRDDASAAPQDQASAQAFLHPGQLPDDSAGLVPARAEDPALTAQPDQGLVNNQAAQTNNDPLAAIWSHPAFRDSSASATLARDLVRAASTATAASAALASSASRPVSPGAAGGAGLPAGSLAGANPSLLSSGSGVGISAQSVTVHTVQPLAGDDTMGNNVAYIARQVTGAWYQPVYNVAADAGVQTNDRPVFAGDLLQSVPVGMTAAVPWTSVATLTTTQGGTVQLHPDGGFSYVPPRTPVIPDTPDTFRYIDLELVSSGSSVSGMTAPATVEIYRIEANPTDLLPGNPEPALEDLGAWAKFHGAVTNTGTDLSGQGSSTPHVLYTDSFTTAVEGSPVAGRSAGANAFFVENDHNVASINASNGRVNWISPVETGPVHSAPLVLSSFLGDQIVVGVENSGPQQPDLVTLGAETGAQVGSFTAWENYTFSNGSTFANAQGPSMSSPTLFTNTNGNTGPYVIFGTDGTQGHGQSGGRLYAVTADGTVVWETLLAGTIHGSPLITPPSQIDPHGAVYVGTGPNDWGGRPEAPGAHQGRFYKLDPITGAVLAETFLDGSIEGSALFAPSRIPGDPDPYGANASVVVTSQMGTILNVTPVVTTPSSGKETPELVAHWSFLGGLHPTSPALDPSGTKLYVGESDGLRSLPLADPSGPGGWVVGSDASGISIGGIQGSPAVTTDANTGMPEIIFGTTTAGGGVYGFRDTGSQAAQVWGLTGTLAYGYSSPAVTAFGREGGQSIVFLGATNGTVLGIG